MIDQEQYEHLGKEARLAEIRAAVDSVVDGLGLGIDEGIKDTVVYLNAFGLPTRQSCEGHNEADCLGAPWVDISPLPVFQDSPLDEPGAWVREDLEAREVAEQELRASVLVLLVEFYRNRAVPYDTMLHLDSRGGLRLESNGAYTFEAEKLVEYQAEMAAFTSFLGDVYHAE